MYDRIYNKSTGKYFKIQGDYMQKLKFSNGELMWVEEHMQSTIDYHSHDFFELAYIREDKIFHLLDGEEFEVRKGDYFIIDTNSKHRYITHQNSPCPIYNCLFYPEAIDVTLSHCRSFKSLIESYLIKFDISILKFNPTAYVFHDGDGSIENLLKKIMNEFSQNRHGSIQICSGALVEILILTMRKIVDENKIIKKNSPTKYIIDEISKRFNEDITLSKICEPLNYSLPYISTKFKKDTGYSFTEYLQKYRIENSLRLLSNTDDKIIDIASAVGYDDVDFFGKIFKKYVNMSPAKYRKISG